MKLNDPVCPDLAEKIKRSRGNFKKADLIYDQTLNLLWNV